nr:hypothetical protein [Tanacetum cinerariifolium]
MRALSLGCLSWLCLRQLSVYSARLRNSMISSLSITQNSHNSLTSCSTYTARSCDRVIMPLAILNESRVTTLCCSNNLTLARRAIVSCLADAKLAHRCPTDSICSCGGGTAGGGGYGSGDGDTDGGSDGEVNLDLLRDKNGKSDGGGKDDYSKSDGGDDDDGKSGGGDVGISFPGRRAKAGLVGRGCVGGAWTTDRRLKIGHGVAVAVDFVEDGFFAEEKRADTKSKRGEDLLKAEETTANGDANVVVVVVVKFKAAGWSCRRPPFLSCRSSYRSTTSHRRFRDEASVQLVLKITFFLI